MARQTIITDDIDGSTPAQTVSFAFEGRYMEIDLSEEHLAEFRELMSPYLEHGRDVEIAPPPPPHTRRGRPARSIPVPQGREDLPAVRLWAREQGLTVAERGRISRKILDAYDKAHPSVT